MPTAAGLIRHVGVASLINNNQRNPVGTERYRAGQLPYAGRVPNPPPYRIVQWTTGNVGKSSVQAVAANPTLELVGCYAYSTDKVGRDVGDLVGIRPLGVTATNDVDALLALKPDCVVYNPMWINYV